MVMSKCCCCIPLRAGSIIISLLWLLYGIYAVITAALALGSSDNVDKRLNGYGISTVILFGLIVVGATFGLFVLICANRPRMVSIYSKIAYAIVAIIIANQIVRIVIFVTHKSEVEYACTISGNPNVSKNVLLNVCIVGIALGAIIPILVSVYFGLVISAYARKKNEKAAADDDGRVVIG